MTLPTTLFILSAIFQIDLIEKQLHNVLCALTEYIYSLPPVARELEHFQLLD